MNLPDGCTQTDIDRAYYGLHGQARIDFKDALAASLEERGHSIDGLSPTDIEGRWLAYIEDGVPYADVVDVAVEILEG